MYINIDENAERMIASTLENLKKDGTIVITALPSTKDVDSVRKVIEKEILLDKIDLRDESTYTTRIVIEKVYKKQCDMTELYNRLYKKLQASENYNFAFYDENSIYVPCSFDNVVKANLLLVLQIIESLKKTNNWKDIFDLSYDNAIKYLSTKFKACTVEIAKEVFRKPMSYLTKAHDQEIIDLTNLIAELKTDKSDIFEMLAKKYKTIKTKVLKEINPNETTFLEETKTTK